MAAAGEEQVRPNPNGDGAAEIKQKPQRNQQPDMEQLIGPGTRVKLPLGVATRFGDTRMDQSHIPDVKEPHKARIRGAELEPRQRTIESVEQNHFCRYANDVEKIVPAIERPLD